MGWNILLVCPLMHYRLAGFGFLLLVCLGAGQALRAVVSVKIVHLKKWRKKKKGFLLLDFFWSGCFAFNFQTQEAQIVPDISLKCSIPFAIRTNRYSTYSIGTKWHLFQHKISDTQNGNQPKKIQTPNKLKKLKKLTLGNNNYLHRLQTTS